MSQFIRFTFKGRAQGGTKVEAVGYQGHGCQEDVTRLMGSVGVSLDSVVQTEDYYKEEPLLTEKEKELE